MYSVYTKHKRYKKAFPDGFHTDSLENAKKAADRQAKSWWAENGIYDWIKVRDDVTKKYIYTAFAKEELK